MSRIKDIIVGITPTSATSLYPTATSCETTRTPTTNGFRVNTSSADGIYNKRKSKTTPAGDDKNRLVNDYTEGEDRHSSTDYSNGVQNNKINLHIEYESCDKMAISISEDLSNHNFPADEKNEIANETNNGYVPDDEHSDENGEQGKIKSDEIAVSSPVDNKNNDNHEIESKSKSNSQNEDIKLQKSMEDEDPSSSNGGQNNRAMTNSEDVSGNDGPSSDNGDVPRQAQYNGDVPHQAQSNGDVLHQAQSNSDVTYQAQSNGAQFNGDVPHQAQSNSDVTYQAQSNGAQFNSDVPHQAQSNGDFHHQEISRNDIENIAKANVETFIHGQMSEMRRDMTEHTNNTINQVREEVLTFQHDITDKMLQQSNEFKEQINKSTEKLLEKKVEASGGKQDNATSEIIENKNEIQKLLDEMNRLSEILRQQISQQKGVVSVPDTPLFTRTTHVGESSPHSNNVLRSRIASDDALYNRHSGSLATPDQYSELEKKRKKKKKKRTPSIHFPACGTVHIQHEDNSIDIEQIGPMEVQHVNRGIRLIGGNIEIDIKSPRKKIITPKPQKDQST
ncbi:unnamed protein product [Mytilus coruscus]|uniref:Uncharacterized protein n=1 Tax=Mytilus coruscus TaxID=42192 RepID=A0A6J8A4W6_MYTCO|nr:unnamed protein product [Mytilus coruscus]